MENLCISPFTPVSYGFKYLEFLLLHIYNFRIFLFSWQIDALNIKKNSPFIFVIVLVLESSLSDIYTAVLAFLWLVFVKYIDFIFLIC